MPWNLPIQSVRPCAGCVLIICRSGAELEHQQTQELLPNPEFTGTGLMHWLALAIPRRNTVRPVGERSASDFGGCLLPPVV
jgi:hypothetical protein